MQENQSMGTQGGAQGTSGVETSLETAFRTFNDAFNRFDTREVAACWAEDGTLITPTGEVGTGRAGVEAAFRHDCETILAGTRSRFTITSTRRLANDLAFVDLDHELQGVHRPDGSRGDMKLHVVILARRTGDTWRWLDARPYAFLPAPPVMH